MYEAFALLLNQNIISPGIYGESTFLPYANKINKVQEFRIRRCCLMIDKMLEEKGIVYFEKVREACAIESKNFKEIRPYLADYITQKNRVIRI